ncbi:SGNH/GDSL hydrolase family protein [Aestuariispira insulae]|uniref:SGNH hydrolase-type esterase domain-containing protein n=1 Tax=Aestuariispira insulae TaxID=1461337 RepID=A0A3D9HS50_9PROT|nr:GDSL-type esterase/lipase family protein [Aestuariispira insulae]RED52245.1 hypothetical protein DFP90_102263 [Aestuariispira insulae]
MTRRGWGLLLLIALLLAGIGLMAGRPLWHEFQGSLRQDGYREILTAHQLRQDRNLPPGRVLLFGASTIQGIDTARLSCPASNFGIGGETAEELMARLSHYHSIDQAAAIIVQTGLNNLLQGRTDGLETTLVKILDSLPREKPILMLAHQHVGPIEGLDSPPDIALWNRRIASLCEARTNCRMITPPPMRNYRPDYLEPDRIHLNRPGYDLLIGELNRALTPQAGSPSDCPA